MESVTDIFAVISIFIGLPSIITVGVLARRYLKIIERREDIHRQELANDERRLTLEERERELEIYRLELEIRRLEQGNASGASDTETDSKQLR